MYQDDYDNILQNSSRSLLEKFFRNRWFWLFLIILADLISISWVSLDEAFNPLILLFAGLGIVLLFSSFIQPEIMVFVSVLSYLGFIIFLIFIKKIKTRYLHVFGFYFIFSNYTSWLQ